MEEVNRIYAYRDPHDPEGPYKRVLCVCSAGMLRSPTTALVLSQEPYNCNTRIAGTEDYAITPVTDSLILWCEEVVCMEEHHARKIRERWIGVVKPITVLRIPDNYSYRDPKLMELIRKKYDAAWGLNESQKS